ncbi:hypothetical protein P9D43_20905 [Neobacillus niacini]|uniref:hypothetical protein n=1 Tax=Neobacillus niacini TaxID=86668 RepID=UPI0007AC09CF|nr:hypothetical protein [Neobacillus niacini]MEC1524466.1 hypothetical protein [Neobacillus niacini]
MFIKDGNKEIQFGSGGDVFLGTLAIGAVTFLGYKLMEGGKIVLEKLIGRDDLPEVLDKTSKIINLEDHKNKSIEKNIKRTWNK